VARSIWSGAIAFGLVNVPVQLYTAISPKEIKFHLLHEKDGGRIHLQRVCSIDEEVVPWNEIAKGYEVSRGRHVLVSPEELDAIDPKATHTIDIDAFVDIGDIDPIYYEATYHVVPEEGAGRAYALLLEAMEKQGKVAVATMVLRTKQHLCSLRPMGKGLVLSTMQYADEIVPRADVATPVSAKPTEKELKLAEQLIGSLSAKFEPEKYGDEYRERVLDLVEKKAKGEIIETPGPEREPEVIDLADALSRSLGRSPAEKAEKTKARAAHHARRPRRKAS
jgi:DNA end-binding protein Ku